MMTNCEDDDSGLRYWQEVGQYEDDEALPEHKRAGYAERVQEQAEMARKEKRESND
jgi:hypothetical protein